MMLQSCLHHEWVDIGLGLVMRHLIAYFIINTHKNLTSMPIHLSKSLSGCCHIDDAPRIEEARYTTHANCTVPSVISSHFCCSPRHAGPPASRVAVEFTRSLSISSLLHSYVLLCSTFAWLSPCLFSTATRLARSLASSQPQPLPSTPDNTNKKCCGMSSLRAPPCSSKAHLLLHFLAPHTAHLDCKEDNSAWQHKPLWAALQNSGKCYQSGAISQPLLSIR